MSEDKKMKMELQCPMPKFDFDKITLAHGSGGLLTNRLLDSGVFDVLSNDILDNRHDGAFLSLQGNIAMTTDSFVISPIAFPGGNIGELAVNGTVNDLAMCGATPQYLSLSFIIEEGLEMKDFWEVLTAVKSACDEAGVLVVTGDTKVVERGKGDQIFINTTGIGTVMTNASISLDRVQSTDAIIVSHQIAAHGMAIMSVREGLEFETTIESDTRPLHQPVKALINEFGDKIKLLKDATRGGISSVLNEVARDTNLGINLQQRLIPIDPQVKGACELLGLDPLYVANEGVFIAIVEETIADQCVDLLKTISYTESACRIGTVTDEHPKQVIMESAIGGRRVVNMLIGEQLPRIC